MIEPALATCRRTPAIVEAILDGSDRAVDRSHVAACATCRRESERALRFISGLRTGAVEASEGIPDPALVRTGRLAGLRLPLMRLATMAGAVAAGLVIAAVVGTRVQTPATQQTSPFAAVEAAPGALAPIGLVCGDLAAGMLDCRSIAPDHVHSVQLRVVDGRIVGAEARIESTDGNALDLRGVEVLFARIAGAVLTAEVETAARTWIRDAYPTCGAGCSTDVAGVSLALAVEDRFVSLSLRER